MIYKINLAKMRFQILISILCIVFVFSQPVNAEFLRKNVPSGQIVFEKSSVKNAQINNDLCMMNIETFKERCIANDLTKNETDPQWSPDGKILAYQVADLPLGEGKTETHLYDLEQDQVTVLPTAWLIDSWSPDGKRFVTTDFIDRRGFGEITIVRLDDYEVERLTDNTVADLQPAWSPDGNRIAYLSGFPDSDLMVMSSDGSNQKQLTTALKGNYEVKPVWSSDGQQIAFVANTKSDNGNDVSEIYLINADGSNLRQLTTLGNTTFDPRWSPDGKRVVFWGFGVDAYDEKGNFLGADIFVINADGSELTNLTDHAGLNSQPAWSPDGTWIAFASTRPWESENGRSGIFIMRPDGTDLKMLTNEPPVIEGGSSLTNPVWRPQPVTPQ